MLRAFILFLRKRWLLFSLVGLCILVVSQVQRATMDRSSRHLLSSPSFGWVSRLYPASHLNMNTVYRFAYLLTRFKGNSDDRVAITKAREMVSPWRKCEPALATVVGNLIFSASATREINPPSALVGRRVQRGRQLV